MSSRRVCPVCAEEYVDLPKCGHVDGRGNITLTMPENETILVAKKIFNPYRSW